MTLPRRTEVLVIGAGLAGYAAAIEARARGAQTVLLEKMPCPGGSSRISSGFFAFSDTQDQRAAGVTDSADIFYQDLRRVGGEANDPAMLRAFLEHQSDACHWLRLRGVTFEPVRATAGQSVPRTHIAAMRPLFERLVVEFPPFTNIALERLRRIGGRVATAHVRDAEGRQYAIQASRGIVLTTGGFSQSEDLLRNFAPLQAASVRLGGLGNTGDGLRAAWDLGAGFRDMGFIRGTFGCHPSARVTYEPDAVRMPISTGGIAVNRQAERFVNEARTYKEIGDACLRQDQGMAFQIFDAAMLAKGSSGTGPLGLRTGLEAGWIVCEPTLDALAVRLDLNPSVLRRTISVYNRDATAGRDTAFGRATLVGGFGGLASIETPPFYGFPCTSSVLATYCGLTVDPSTRVLDVFGTPIPGLYAAGEITGGFHGASYMAGTALAKALVFGRLAGRAAAASGAGGPEPLPFPNVSESGHDP